MGAGLERNKMISELKNDSEFNIYKKILLAKSQLEKYNEAKNNATSNLSKIFISEKNIDEIHNTSKYDKIFYISSIKNVSKNELNKKSNEELTVIIYNSLNPLKNVGTYVQKPLGIQNKSINGNNIICLTKLYINESY